MTVRRKMYHMATPALIAIVGFAACDGRESSPLATPVEAGSAHASHDVVNTPEVRRWLAGLRQATVAYKDYDAAAPAGWDEPILPCMELEGEGGMGQHYIDGEAMAELTPQEFAPELLVYEPQKNGRNRLVAVEYAVPMALWGAEPPVLHGVEFHRNEALGLWVLHAWIWKNNPEGMFADWNPTVNCDYAPAED
ncbi:MAG TPA: hypothetical protein VHG09_01025 [Longimicrobiales bacterium]|nr:hypothetical protein [Longimicrobiales bacterium]